jgi:osmotically-inducible protein OsmY
MPKNYVAYDRSVKSLNDADGYEFSGESEYTREKSDPYLMVDYMIDRGVDYRGRGPKGYFPSDLRIKEDVCEVLTRDPRIDASEISVRVDSGVVMLQGMVDSRQTKRLAEIAIQDLPGVNDVLNQLNFLPPV